METDRKSSVTDAETVSVKGCSLLVSPWEIAFSMIGWNVNFGISANSRGD
ncbi:MAG: hypothetical protein V8S28_06160 [Lachnospiraceae bacterium]